MTSNPARSSTQQTQAHVLQRDFRVMGCQAHLVVHGGSEEMLEAAERRLHELESWWSRFRDDSDITRANQSAGLAVQVHGDTLAVVGRALDAKARPP